MKYLVVEENGFVSNAIVWDGVSRFNTRGRILIALDDAPQGAWIGWKYANGEWTAPPRQQELEEQ